MMNRGMTVYLFAMFFAALLVLFSLWPALVFASDVEPGSVSVSETESVSIDDSSVVSGESKVESESLAVSDESELVPESDERPFLSTPLDDYTVTEGLLLVLVLGFAAVGLFKLFRVRRVM